MVYIHASAACDFGQFSRTLSSNLNPVLPIFSRATLHAAIDVQYDPQTLLPDPAWWCALTT